METIELGVVRRILAAMRTVKALVLSIALMIVLPFWMVRMPAAIQTAYQIERAPRHLVTVESTTTKPSPDRLLSLRRDEYWIRFLEPVANTRDMRLSDDDDLGLVPGRRIQIAVTPDGTPHSARSRSCRAECLNLFFTACLWLYSAGVSVYLVYGAMFGNESKEPKPNDELLSPAVER